MKLLENALQAPQSVAVTADRTLDSGDTHVEANATSAAITLTLQPAAAAAIEHQIIKTDSSGNTVTIDPDGSELINGSATMVLTTQYDAVRIRSNGSTWYIW